MDGQGTNDNVVGEKEFELVALKNEIQRLNNELIKYKILLKEVDSDANPEIVSDEEAICVEQIRILKESSAKRQLTTDEVKRLDLLHKNLKMSRGEGTRIGNKNKAGKMSAEELAKIAKGE